MQELIVKVEDNLAAITDNEPVGAGDLTDVGQLSVESVTQFL